MHGPLDISNALPPTVPSPPKGMNSSSSLSQTSASQPMASQLPTGPCHGAPPKKDPPRIQGRMPDQIPSSLAPAPSQEPGPKSSQEPHLLRKRKPHLRPRQPWWAPVSLGRGRKEMQTKMAVSNSSFLGFFIYITLTATSLQVAGTGCWDPKLDRTLNKFKSMRLLWRKWSFLLAR